MHVYMYINYDLKFSEFPLACRCCLYIKADMISLHAAELPKMFLTTTGLQVDPTLPVNICKNCIRQLNTAYAFITTCHGSTNHLKKIIEQNKPLEINSDQNLNSNTEPEYIVPEVLINEDKEAENIIPDDEATNDNENKVKIEIHEESLEAVNTQNLIDDSKIIEIKSEREAEIDILEEDNKLSDSPQGKFQEKALVCYMCNELFSTLEQVRQHINKYHVTIFKKKVSYKCLCKRRFLTKRGRTEHQKRNCSILLPTKCTICNLDCKTVTELVQHRKRHNSHQVRDLQRVRSATRETNSKPNSKTRRLDEERSQKWQERQKQLKAKRQFRTLLSETLHQQFELEKDETEPITSFEFVSTDS